MDKSLLFHLYLDRNYFPRSLSLVELLQERYGYVPSIEKIANRACSSLDKKFIQEKGYQWIDIPENSWIGCGCRIHILRRSVVDVPEGIRGEAHLNAASIDQHNKIQNVDVDFYVGEDRKVQDSEFKNTISHELTHVYEFLQRSIRMMNVPEDSQAFKKIQDSSVRHSVLGQLQKDASQYTGFAKSLRGMLSSCLYLCSPLEQNAFNAQMKAELSSRANELSDFRKAAEIVEETTAWKNLQVVRRNFQKLQKLQHDSNKAVVVKWCSAYFGNITTFNQAIKRIEYELDRFERRIKNRVGKMCGELYQNSEEYLKECRRYVDPGPFLLVGEELEEE